MNMNYRGAWISGVLFAVLAVITGAFGAHLLKDLLIETNRVETFELAVRYQFYHAFALLITGIIQKIGNTGSLKWAPLCFFGGIIFFSGSLYVLCFTGIKQLGAITPIGGLLFIAGWLILLVVVIKRK
jgi:uncharacterized membrane protein YgdD (TMEM256/DUF423 family)